MRDSALNAKRRLRYQCDHFGTSIPARSIIRDSAADWPRLGTIDLGAPILEYEAVGKREAENLKISFGTIDAIVQAFCFFGRDPDICFRLRPFLPDPGDEFIVELAVAGRADAIVTHNVRHFRVAAELGIPVLTPREFLKTIGVEK